MGIFSESNDTCMNDVNMDAILEMFLVEDASKLNQLQLQEFCAPGGALDALCEAKVAKKYAKNTIVRMSKTDDLDRRTMLVAMQMAKEAGAAEWEKLVKNRIIEKELLSKIKTRFGHQAERVAIAAQKEYVKNVRKVPSSFMKFGGAERV